MFNKFYRWFHNVTARPEERGEYSAGHWQDVVRTTAVNCCTRNQGRVLEVGCGEGLFLLKLAESHPHLEIEGVDNCQERVKDARAKLDEHGFTQVKLSCSDATRLPFADASFDTVVCINVLFNLPSGNVVSQSFQEIARVLKPRGQFVFDIRNKANPLLTVKYKLAKYYDETVRDLPLRTFHLNAIKEELAKMGFQEINACPVSFPRNRWSPIFVIEAGKDKP